MFKRKIVIQCSLSITAINSLVQIAPRHILQALCLTLEPWISLCSSNTSSPDGQHVLSTF